MEVKKFGIWEGAWGIRRRYENGHYGMSTKRFLGYDTDEKDKLVINQEQAKIVERLYESRKLIVRFMEGTEFELGGE